MCLKLYCQVHPAPTTGSRSASTGSTSSGFSSETSPSLTSPQPGMLTFLYSTLLIIKNPLSVSTVHYCRSVPRARHARLSQQTPAASQAPAAAAATSIWQTATAAGLLTQQVPGKQEKQWLICTLEKLIKETF